MSPKIVKFFLYAEDDSEVEDLQRSLHDLVSSLYSEGVYVSAKKLNALIRQFGSNPIFKQFLK